MLLLVVSEGVAALLSAMRRRSCRCCFCSASLLLQGVGAKGCVGCTTMGSSVWQLSWQKYYRVYMSREQEKAGCGLFYPFLYDLKTPENTCYLCVLGKLGFEIMLFLTALCLVADCCISKVCHSFNFSFKTRLEVATYFLCLGQRCNFCAVKGKTQVGEQGFLL